MNEPAPKSMLSRLKTPLILAAVGICTVALGTAAGLWLFPPSTDSDAGKHSDAWKNPHRVRPTGKEPGHAELTDLLAEDELNAATMPARWDESASDTDRIANHVKIGDDALRIGDYARAISVYRFLLPYTSGAHEAAVRYRLALSSECSGADTEALRQYLAIAQKHAQSNWSDVAELGRTRCIADDAHGGTLDSIVYRCMLDHTALTPPVRREVLHTAARGLCSLLLPRQQEDILNPNVLLLSSHHLEPNEELAKLPELLKAQSIPPSDSAFEMFPKIDNNPENIYFRIHTRRASLKTLLTRLAEHSGLGLNFTPTALESIVARKQAVHSDDISMSLLLDGLCVPFGLVWRLDTNTIVVSTTEELPEEEHRAFFRQRVERLLDIARMEGTASPQACHTTIARACLLFENGRVADAAHLLRTQLQSENAPNVDVEAAFNLGRCYSALEQREEAEQAWYRCVDAGGKDRLTRSAAYLCLARLQLEDAQYQRAITSLRMGLALATGGPLEQQSAAMLGCAYLMGGNAPAANKVHYTHETSLQDPAVVQSVALVGALARYRSVALPEQKVREAHDVVASLSHFDPATAFGAHWFVLAAQAAEETGMSELSIRYYAQAAQQLTDGGLRQSVMLRLADLYRDEHQLQEADRVLQAVGSQKADPLTHEIELQKADLAFRQGDLQAAIDRCYEIVVASEEQPIRRRALKLMGRAFEKRQDHESAVYCFAGMLPRNMASQAVRPAGHRGLK